VAIVWSLVKSCLVATVVVMAERAASCFDTDSLKFSSWAKIRVLESFLANILLSLYEWLIRVVATDSEIEGSSR
jgi:hypothetical protein